MDVYHLVLFVHICALLAAIGASALVHVSEIRMQAAQTKGEVRQWGMLAGSMDKVFPLALLTLFATGAYLVASRWAWNLGWVDVAVGGVVLLFLGGGFLGSRGKALMRATEGDPHAPVDGVLMRVMRDPLTRSISSGNTGLAIGIVFIMVNKPPLLGALAALILAVAIGVVLAIPPWRGEPAGARAATVLADTSAGGRSERRA